MRSADGGTDEMMIWYVEGADQNQNASNELLQ